VERIVKERLVGAAVLMAAAIILIPEMLSGPDR
jgi:DedD protein